MTDRLLSFPFVVVRVSCTRCSRAGTYRLARLAERYGAEIRMAELLSADCRFRSIKRVAGHYERCGAIYPDLVKPTPPDLPPSARRLRVVKGGQAAE